MVAKYVCVDLETSGLDPNTCGILEASWAVLDHQYLIVGDISETFVRMEEDEVFEDQALIFHREKTGLAEAFCDEEAVDYDQLDARLCQAVTNIEKPILVGNSPQFDHSFIASRLPNFASRLSHQRLDVSTLQMAVESAAGLAPRQLRKVLEINTPHRAKGDVMSCIEVLQVCRNLLCYAVQNPKTDQELYRLTIEALP